MSERIANRFGVTELEFRQCPGNPAFREHDCVVRRFPTRAERAQTTERYGRAGYRDLGSINWFTERAPGIWVAQILWESCRISHVRVDRIEQAREWMDRVGIPRSSDQ